MYGAFFAATAGTCDKGMITYEGETLEQVQACRERILYAARDQIAVEAELGHRFKADQRALAKELFPKEDWGGTAEHSAVMSRLVQHYNEIEAEDLETTVTKRMWARAGELRAAAMVLREPIDVLDVQADQTIFAQQYSYQLERRETSVLIESRLQRTISMEKFTQLVKAALLSKVLLPILLLRHRDGAQHFQALRFSDFMYERYANSETGSTKPCMRERLDKVHESLSMAPVSAEPNYIFTSPDTSSSSGLESDSIAPPSVARSRSPGGSSTEASESSSKNDSVRARVHRADLQTYDRILSLGGALDRGTVADRNKHRAFSEANKQVHREWHANNVRVGVKSLPISVQALEAIDITDKELFRNCLALFYQLPYPAIAAQQLGHSVLCRWGGQLALQAQLKLLESVIADDTLPDGVQEMARSWNNAVTSTLDPVAQGVLVNDISRWKRLRRAGANISLGHKPTRMPVVAWNMCNVLPYLLWNWRPIELDCVAPDQTWVSIGAIKQLFIDNDHAESVISRVLSTNDWRETRTAVRTASPDSQAAGGLGFTSGPDAGSCVANRS